MLKQNSSFCGYHVSNSNMDRKKEMKVKHADCPNQKMILLYPETVDDVIKLKELSDHGIGELHFISENHKDKINRLNIHIDLLMDIFNNIMWHNIIFK